MKLIPSALALLLSMAGLCWAARCTTIGTARALEEYENYVKGAEQQMPLRFAKGELAWVQEEDERGRLFTDLGRGNPVRVNISQPTVNQRVAEWNGTVIDWVGAVRIRDTSLAQLRAVLEDFGHHATIYKPMIYDCRARKVSDGGDAYDVSYGFQNTYRAASIFPQHYSFDVKARMEFSDAGSRTDPVLTAHSRSREIRESDSGVPGRDDFLEPNHDHGILWALNTYWRAHAVGRDLYVEFEAITLARSIQDFMCKIGILPVPKYVVARVMDSLPGESLDLMLSATKAECERRSLLRSSQLSPGQ